MPRANQFFPKVGVQVAHAGGNALDVEIMCFAIDLLMILTGEEVKFQEIYVSCKDEPQQ